MALPSPLSPLQQAFLQASSGSQVAQVLGISWRRLTYVLYRLDQGKKYHEFEIPKRAGGVRRIAAPLPPIAGLQSYLKDILYSLHQPSKSSHGFVRGRSIITNAGLHVHMRWVLNIDLQDFFPTINFGRVRGLFMASPFQIPSAAATVLAQICCNGNALPQGAPTSPIISDMICRKLDHQLWSFSRSLNCYYSRYADDITISTRSPSLPASIARIDTSAERGVVVGEELANIIAGNGFLINPTKVRLASKARRQEVTGLVVNERINVRRKLIREVRAMLHKVEIGNSHLARIAASQTPGGSSESPVSNNSALLASVQGKIDFIRHVRGREDRIYSSLQHRLNQLTGKAELLPAILDPRLALLFSALWVLGTEDAGNLGTGFEIASAFVVTCSHVLTDSMMMHRWQDPIHPFGIEILTKDPDRDIAILRCPLEPISELPLGSDPRYLDPVLVAGFPPGVPGTQPFVAEGKVAQVVKRHGLKRIKVTAHIERGMSGGPVIGQDGRIVGVAVSGIDSSISATTTLYDIEREFGVLPVSLLENVLQQLSRR